MMEWTDVSIGEVAKSTKAGFSKSPEQGDKGVPHLRPNNVSRSGRIDLKEVKTVVPSKGEKEKYLLHSGDVLFNNTNSAELVGKTALFIEQDGPYTFSNHMTRIRVNEEVANSRFVARCLHWKWKTGHLEKFVTRWVSQAAINQTKLADVALPLPPLTEQQRIVALLDRADALRRKRAAADAKAQRIRPALFYRMFGDPAANPEGWDKVPLGDLITKGPRNGLYKPKRDYGQGTRILRIDGFYDGRITDPQALQRVEVSDEERQKFLLEEGEIVVNRVNSEEYLGKCALVPDLSEPTLFESNMMRFAVDTERVHPVYLAQHLQTTATKAEILQKAKRAINQASINQQDVKSFSIALPPLERQKAFAQRAATLERARERRAASQERLDRLFDVLLHRAFSGQLTEAWRAERRDELKAEQREQLHALGRAEKQAALFA